MNSNYPKYAQVGDKKYKINTDFRVAIKCNEVAQKDDISDEERALAIIYLLFGDEGLKDANAWEELIKIAQKYLNCGKKYKDNKKSKEADMDFEQDWEYIRTSFFSDYRKRIDETTYMHWWEFYNLLCGLSDKCVLNRVRFIRTFDIKQIKDHKEKQKWIEQKEQVALKKKEKQKTPEQKRKDELFKKLIRGE